MGLTLLHGTLSVLERIGAGAIWMMPADGSVPPTRVTEQHRDGFATHPFVAGSQVLAKASKAFLAIAVPGGAITRASVTGAVGVFEAAVGTATTIFLTVFKRDEVFEVPVGGGALQRVIDVPNAVLALHRDTLYVASYATGDLLAIPVAGGAPRAIAHKLHGPTAIVVDDTTAFAYSGARPARDPDRARDRREQHGDRAISFENSDELLLAGRPRSTP